MTRKTFLTTLGAALVAPFFGRLFSSSRTPLVDKFSAIDSQFAVTSSDLAAAIQRIGSTAETIT